MLLTNNPLTAAHSRNGTIDMARYSDVSYRRYHLSYLFVLFSFLTKYFQNILCCLEKWTNERTKITKLIRNWNEEIRLTCQFDCVLTRTAKLRLNRINKNMRMLKQYPTFVIICSCYILINLWERVYRVIHVTCTPEKQLLNSVSNEKSFNTKVA